MLKYHFYKMLRMFHLISKKKFKEKFPSEYKIIAKSKLFDKKWYLKHNPDVSKNDPILHYLQNGWKEGQNPSQKFDGNEYLKQYPDVKSANICPLIHYELFGKKENRTIPICLVSDIKLNIFEKLRWKFLKCLKSMRIISTEYYEVSIKQYQYLDYRTIYKSKLFDKKYYRKRYGKDNINNTIDHYLHIGFKLGYNPSKQFDNDYYLTTNTDILKANMNPLFHYELWGKFEGRKTSVILNKHIPYAINTNANSVLLVSHELSLTGAPIALLNMAKILKKNGYNPVILSPTHGELEEELKNNHIKYIIEPYLMIKSYKQDDNFITFLNSFSTILFNTIDTLKYAQYIDTNNKKICWVHEGEFGYKCAEAAFDIQKSFNNINEVYSVGNYSKSFTDKYISPEKSKILLYGIENIKTNFEINKTKSNKIVIGIFGVCCERKGHDLFINTVKSLPDNVKDNCIFKVIGRIDNNDFCTKLLKEAESENIVFTGQLSHDDTLIEMKHMDIVCCPSLDDPMPIVMTEAMQFKKVVICSNKTGTANFIKHGINGYIYNIETDDLSQIIIDAYNNKEQFSKLGNNWHQIYLDNFTNDIFEKNILTIFSNIKLPTNSDIFRLLSSVSNKMDYLCANLGANI